MMRIAVSLAAALLAVSAAAQQSSKPSPYQGVSRPPADDAIVTTEDHPVSIARPAAAVSASAAVKTSPAQAAPSPSKSQADPDADIVTAVPQSAVPAGTATARAGTPALHTRSADPDADIVQVAPPRAGELAEGTPIRVRIQQSISTSDTEKGFPFSAIVMAPVTQGGKVVIPMGSEIRGRVVSVSSGKAIGGKATIRLRPDVVVLPDGSRYLIHAQVIDSQGTDTRADGEGTITNKSHVKKDAVLYGAAAGTGALVGAKVAGGAGALVGTAIGAGIVTAHLLMQTHQAELPRDSVLVFGLTEPLSLSPVHN